MHTPSLHGLLSLYVLAGTCCILSSAQPQPRRVAYWPFDGTLTDAGGGANHANGMAPVFATGHVGQGLRSGSAAVVVPDRSGLRLAPGLRIDCWVRLATLPTGYDPILIKEGEYQLRVDPPHEGGRFTFFTHLNGHWDPRVGSREAAKAGAWYHLVAGWDGETLSLAVNGDTTTLPRSGVPLPRDEPLEIGSVDGIIDELRIENPNAVPTAVARWSFDGNLHDASSTGPDLSGEGARFVAGRSGQALQGGSAPAQVPSSPELQLAPGIRIDCTVRLDKDPAGGRHLVFKDGEYQLRVNPAREGGQFAFFVNLDGGWEPRVCSKARAETGVWYRVIARWDGLTTYLDVNGEQTKTGHAGRPHPTDNPLRVGTTGVLVDDLEIENPRQPILRVRNLVQQHAIPRIGRRETITAILCNIGPQATRARADLVLPRGVRYLDGAIRELGDLPTGATTNVSWTLLADSEITGRLDVRLSADDCVPTTRQYPLAFLPHGNRVPEFRRTGAALPGATTYFVDSREGRNTNPGTTADKPWRDFTNVNGKTLGPGETLLIKRGSVINQELVLSAQGTPDHWAAIGTYGKGARPVIRRNWDIDDRCVLVHDPDFLRISGIVVCYAAKGLVVTYRRNGHQGLIIEDCIAHHIEGLYRPNSSGIPEWHGRSGPTGDAFRSSAGIAITGGQATSLLVRDCEMFQTSWGFFIKGDAATIDRVYCHDNYCYNTSPHPAIVGATRSFLQNSIFDRSGGHAYAGTMGIMLVGQQNLTIRNCTFRNQPDSGSHDEGGIDFENTGNGCVIDNCTFDNNAGAAIEVLGLQTPQARNLDIRNSRFIRNNTADKLGPAEIYIWGKQPNPDVCCSSGTIRGNGYVTLPGVRFFVNEAPELTQWRLHDNTAYDSVEALERAMPYNKPPVVDAGRDLHTDQTTVQLAGRVSDDGKPGRTPMSVRWELLEGPGPVVFRDAGAPATTADFAATGDYLLRLVGDDGELWLSDIVAVHILPPGTVAAAAWEFNTLLDKEGWTEVNPGTRVRKEGSDQWPCTAHPVKYVAGGYYILAIDSSPDAHLLSPTPIGTDLAACRAVTIRFQNHTPATRMRFRFTTDADTAWDESKSRPFDVVPDDDAPRSYSVDMSRVPGWSGRLKQLRLDFATGSPVTGTCRIDYIRLERRHGASK